MIVYYKIEPKRYLAIQCVECTIILREEGRDRMIKVHNASSFELMEFAVKEFLKEHEVREGFGVLEVMLGKLEEDYDLSNRFAKFVHSVEQRANDQEIERQVDKGF